MPRLHPTAHPAFQRVYSAIESLVVSSGTEADKLYNVALYLLPLHERDFPTDTQKKLFEEVRTILMQYPHERNVDREKLLTTKTLNQLHWKKIRKIKQNILSLFFHMMLEYNNE